MTRPDTPTPQQKLEKRVRSHATTIGVWLASRQERAAGETDREFAERMITLGARHAMEPVNAPLLRRIVDANPFTLVKSGRIQDLTDEDLEGFDFGTGERP